MTVRGGFTAALEVHADFIGRGGVVAIQTKAGSMGTEIAVSNSEVCILTRGP